MQILRAAPVFVAELCWQLRRYVGSFQVAKAKDSLPPLEPTDSQTIAQLADSIIEKDRRWLVRTLVKYPYWLGGHRAYANLSLQTNNIGPAYASAQAMHKLSQSKKINDDSNFIIAKCYLRRGVAAQALPILEELHKDNLERFDIAEEFAAALVACEKYQEAAQLFSTIPSGKISAHGQAAKMFVEERISQPAKQA